MRQTLQEIMTARDTLILLLQNLGFVINLKKLILHPVKQLEFLGLQKNTEEMTVSLRRKTDSDNSAMPGGIPSTQNFNVTFNKVNWPTFVNSQSYIARENSISFFPTRENNKSEKAGELPGVCYSWELSQTKTCLVNREHRTIQWKKNSTTGTSYDHPNRCFHERVGSTLQRNLNRGKSSKCFRIYGCEICNTDFHKKSLNFNCSYSDGQKCYPVVSLENGEHTQSGYFINQQVNLTLSAVSWYHNFSRIFTKQTECPSRLGVSKFQGFLRLETTSKHVSEQNQTIWISKSGPLCIQDVPSTSTIRSMEA